MKTKSTIGPDNTIVDPIREALNDIVAWSEDAPMWQRDALRRLYVQGKLASNDIAELSTLCRQDRDLLDPDEVPITAVPLSADDVPSVSTAGGAVALKSIGRPQNVNALAEDQTLRLSETGLTIVYGDNGAGKSGYGRVLKQACRARDQETILGNVYATSSIKPSAHIEYSVSGQPQPEILWQDGIPANPSLSNISVFDSKCATVHVDGINDLAYTPSPLQLLQALADVSIDFGNRLKAKRTSLETEIPGFKKRPSSREGTAVHRLVLSLTAKTNLTEVSGLAQLSEKEKARLDQLKGILSSDPLKEIRQLRAQKQRVEELVKTVLKSEKVLLPATVEKLRQLIITAIDQTAAVTFAATKAFAKEPLPKAGSAVWKSLWEAAREFSVEEVYPAHPFPHTGAEAVCLLCQQALSKEAETRMIAFEQFVQQKIQKLADAARGTLQSFKDEIKGAYVTDETLKEAARLLGDELDQSPLRGTVIRHLARARVRGRRLVAATDPVSLKAPALTASIIPQIDALVSKMDERITNLQTSSDSEKRKLQEGELRELEDRTWFASILSDVESEIDRLKNVAAFTAAMQDTDTTRITRKTTEISRVIVTNTIRNAFASEIAALGIADRGLEMTQERGEYGSTKFKISLIRNPKAKVAKILSEGEHRCVALAAFLAELSTAQNHSGLIFDDPVSSLDHNYREMVASRLIKEAARGRQVIVFTHDIPFLMVLDDEARSHSLIPNYQCVNRADDRAGICLQGAPSKTQPVPEIVKKVERRLEDTRALHAAGRLDDWSDQVKAIAGLLRDGWERAAESTVAHVVRRFNNKVHTGGLRKLTVLTDADCADLTQGYGFCCTYSHTESTEINRPAPTPDKISAEIDRLKLWVESVRIRQEQKK